MIFSSLSPYRKWLILGLCLQVIAAWYSLGYNQPDEHFQVLEYSNYKMGYSPASDLPWEFSEKCRSAIQPFIACCIFKPLHAMGLFNPFAAVFLLRLLMGIFTWVVTCRILVLLLPEFTTERGKQIYVWCSFFLWFVPYLGVRFSSEHLAGLLFFLALSLFLKERRNPGPSHRYNIAAAGLLLGFALFLRVQLAFAFAGLGIWMLFINKWQWRDWVILACFFLMGCGGSVLIDHWFYGSWVITPYNYFYVNIVQHNAARFGTYPWWYYFWFFIQTAVPPLSIVLLLLLFKGVSKKPWHLFTIIAVIFFIGHDLIGHKEMRFLFPMDFALIFLVSTGIDSFIRQDGVKPLYKWTFRVLCVFNIFLLVVRLFTPAQELVKYYKFIYDYEKTQPTKIVCLNNSPYHEDGLEENFYKPKNLDLQVLQAGDLRQWITNARQPFLFFSTDLHPEPEIWGYKTEMVYCLFPQWILSNNVNGWQQRSHIWAIYKVYPKELNPQ